MVPEFKLLETPDELKDLYLGLTVVKYFIDAAVLVTNGVVVLLLVLQKLFCKQRTPLPPSGYFVVNLLVSDTLVGIILITSQHLKLWPENAVELAKRHYECSFRFAIGFLAVSGSHNALLSMIIDRYLAIAYTLRYRELMTTSRGLRIIAASWVIPVIGWIYLMFFGDWTPGMPSCNEHFMMRNFVYVWMPLFVATMLSIIVIQICVYVKIRHYGSNNPLFVSAVVVRQSSKKSARVMLISTLAFCLGYGPYDVAEMMYLDNPNQKTKLFRDLASIMSSSTFLINPCLYTCKTESVRKRLSNIFMELRKLFVPCGVSNLQTNNQDGGARCIVSVIGTHSNINSNRSRSSSATITTCLEDTGSISNTCN